MASQEPRGDTVNGRLVSPGDSSVFEVTVYRLPRCGATCFALEHNAADGACTPSCL